MLTLGYLLRQAAVLAASNPRLRAKAAQVYKDEVEPRAKEGWARAKPKIEETKTKLGEAVRKAADKMSDD